MPTHLDRGRTALAAELERQRAHGLNPLVLQRKGLDALTRAQTCETVAVSGVDGMADNLITWAITTEAIDRANDIVDPNGLNIARFLDNPTILWCHDAGSPPLGRGMNPRQAVIQGKRGVLLDIHFQRTTEFGRNIHDLILGGFIKAGSIGFIPLHYQDEDPARHPDAYPTIPSVRRFTAWELLEFSPCPIPMNPTALVQGDMGYKAFGSPTELDAIITRAVAGGVLTPDAEFIRRTVGTAPLVVDTSSGTGSVITINQHPVTGTTTAGYVSVTSSGTLITTPAPATDTPLHTTTPQKSMTKSYAEGGNRLVFHLPDAEAGELVRVADAVSASDLGPEGRRTAFKITAVRGLRLGNPKWLTTLLSDTAPVTVELGETCTLPGDDGTEIVALRLSSPSLMALRRAVTENLRTDDCEDYAPVIKLASVTTGRGAQYAGNTTLAGTTITLSDLTLVTPDGTETTITLTGSTTTKSMRTTTKADVPAVAPAAPAPAAPVATPAVAPAPTDLPPAPEAPQDAPLEEATGAEFDAAFCREVGTYITDVIAMCQMAAEKSENDEVKSLAQENVDALTILQGKAEELRAKAEAEIAQAAADAAAEAAKNPPAAPEAPAVDPAAAPAGAPVAAPVQMAYRKTYRYVSKAGRVLRGELLAHVQGIYDSAGVLLAAANAGQIGADEKSVAVTTTPGAVGIDTTSLRVAGKSLDTYLTDFLTERGITLTPVAPEPTETPAPVSLADARKMLGLTD